MVYVIQFGAKIVPVYSPLNIKVKLALQVPATQVIPIYGYGSANVDGDFVQCCCNPSSPRALVGYRL